MRSLSQAGAEELEALQRDTFNYFLNEVNLANGLILDKTAANWPPSIAATGFGCGLLSRRGRTRVYDSPRCSRTNIDDAALPLDDPTPPEIRGFYHFLDMQTGRRA